MNSSPKLLGLVVAFILSSALLFAIWANYLVADEAEAHIHTESADVTPRTVVIVPGARVDADGTPFPALKDRLQCALEIYDAGKARRILVSGDHGQQGYDEVNGMHRWLIERGVSVDHVFMDHAGFRTFDTMERAANIFKIGDAVICTQRFHQDRSIFLARRAGIDAQGLVVDRREYGNANFQIGREFLARARAVFDSYLPFTKPRFSGDAITITGDPTPTHDDSTITTADDL